jgi:ABC-type bacteriocin/lantibiotic exporter with double-glycine peptidase domain
VRTGLGFASGGSAFSNLGVALGGVGSALVFAVGAYEALADRTTPGGVVAAATLAGLLFGPVSRLADLANVFEQAAAGTERLGEILDREPDVVEPASPAPASGRAGSSSSIASASATGRASRSSGTSDSASSRG